MQIEDKRESGGFEKTKIGAFISKLKGIKNIQIIVAIIIIAVALIIYSNVIGKSDSKKVSGADSASIMTDEEARLSQMLSKIDGAGEVSAMITKSDGAVVGVIVVAEGASDITVRLRLLDATSTALGVDKKIINVYSKSS